MNYGLNVTLLGSCFEYRYNQGNFPMDISI